MLGALCTRPPKPWILSPQTFALHHLHSHPHFHPLSPLSLDAVTADGGASIWRMIIPAAAGGGDWRRDHLRPAVHEQKGEGSWNVAWDARPARWLHRLDLAYLLFGVCLVLAPFDLRNNNDAVNVHPEATSDGGDEEKAEIQNDAVDGGADGGATSYRVTGVLADGRCLFRAIAHGECLQSGKEAPDENRQRELADELRAQVVDELLKRRKEMAGFIEEDFDAYVKRIQQPYVWGGEPELLMASHVLKKPISVFMKDRITGDMTNVADYGGEYKNENESPILVLFHGYGHYDILETPSC